MGVSDLPFVIAVFLILEGLFPFILPSVWKEKMRELSGLAPGQIRMFGFMLVAVGVVLLVIF